ncbi:hypothetical protein NC651_038386 [Populus alba x Populus x berolinensis]|nr:hypothetical protein NC651_038386 [Populus alba x Populus x berolinensis]
MTFAWKVESFERGTWLAMMSPIIPALCDLQLEEEISGNDVIDNPSSMRSSIGRSRNRCYPFLSESITLF